MPLCPGQRKSSDDESGVTYRVTTTQAQAAEMERVATKFEGANSSIQSMLSGLMSQLEVLQTQWVGAGGMSFQQVKTEWNDNMQKINRALSETATAVRTSGQQYTSTDEAAQQKVAATNRGVNLPL